MTVLGIAYDAQYSHCLFCQISYCDSCAARHTSSHANEILRMTSKRLSIQDQTQDLRQCTTCSEVASIFCEDCPLSCCHDCFQKGGSRHIHHSFTVFEAPFHSLNVPSSQSSVPCCKKPTISHCSRCLTGRSSAGLDGTYAD